MFSMTTMFQPLNTTELRPSWRDHSRFLLLAWKFYIHFVFASEEACAFCCCSSKTILFLHKRELMPYGQFLSIATYFFSRDSSLLLSLTVTIWLSLCFRSRERSTGGTFPFSSSYSFITESMAGGDVWLRRHSYLSIILHSLLYLRSSHFQRHKKGMPERVSNPWLLSHGPRR